MTRTIRFDMKYLSAITIFLALVWAAPPPPGPGPGHNHGHGHGHGHGHQPKKFGISYSPYTASGECKPQSLITSDIKTLSAAGEYSYVRIYGTDCDQTARVAHAARQFDMRVFAGVFNLDDFPHSLDPIIAVGHETGWDVFHTISIGNELVQKTNTPETVHAVTDALGTARGILRGKGYQGPVVTVDTYAVLLEHPELCEASDYCAANCHVFFDATQVPARAGGYAKDVARQISDKTGGKKKTVIAESGWPHAGVPNGKAVPGVDEHRAAVGSLKKAFGGDDGPGDVQGGDADLVLFTAFDDLWKQDNEGTFGAEKFWGVF